MRIDKLDVPNKLVTITMEAEEIKDILSALFCAVSASNNNEEYQQIYSRYKVLLDIVDYQDINPGQLLYHGQTYTKIKED